MRLLSDYSWFTIKPIWKMDSSFAYGDRSILHKKFSSIQSALSAARDDGTVLRNYAWIVRGYYALGLMHHDISLNDLFRDGFLRKHQDDISEYFTVLGS